MPGQIGLAGFNGSELLDGLSTRLATMEAGRRDIGRKAAEIILQRVEDNADQSPRRIELTPRIQMGDTLKRH